MCCQSLFTFRLQEKGIILRPFKNCICVLLTILQKIDNFIIDIMSNVGRYTSRDIFSDQTPKKNGAVVRSRSVKALPLKKRKYVGSFSSGNKRQKVITKRRTVGPSNASNRITSRKEGLRTKEGDSNLLNLLEDAKRMNEALEKKVQRLENRRKELAKEVKKLKSVINVALK